MAGLLTALLPSIIGGVASMFKGKKTKYAAQQTPQQSAAYNQLLRMIQSRMGQPSAGMQSGNDALNILYSQFLGRGYNPQGQGGGFAMPGQQRQF